MAQQPLWTRLGMQDPDVFEREARARNRAAGLRGHDLRLGTGKTTRVMLSALDEVAGGNSVCFVADTDGMVRHMRRYVVAWAEKLDLDAALVVDCSGPGVLPFRDVL